MDVGELAIGFESLLHVSASVRAVVAWAVTAAGVDPDDVLVVRVTEAGVEVDAIDDRDLNWPARTVTVSVAAMPHRHPGPTRRTGRR